MLGDQKTIGFLATANAPPARAFYETVLGLTCRGEDDFALVFEVAGSELRIQKVSSVRPLPYTAFGWSVTSIDETARRLVANGVMFLQYDGLTQSEVGIWHAPSGARIAWFKDPDGNLLSLTETEPDHG